LALLLEFQVEKHRVADLAAAGLVVAEAVIAARVTMVEMTAPGRMETQVMGTTETVGMATVTVRAMGKVTGVTTETATALEKNKRSK
jgi:hypothetical protein